MKLHQNTHSPGCKRVRAMLAELELKAEIIDVGAGETRAPEFAALNPNHEVPVLEDDDGFILWESPAILLYLASRYPEKKLLPSDPRGRAEVMRWMFWNAAHLDPAVTGFRDQDVIEPWARGLELDPARMAELQRGWQHHAPILNGHLEGKTWLLGEHITIADLCVGTTVEAGMASGADPRHVPHIVAWLDRLRARPSWAA